MRKIFTILLFFLFGSLYSQESTEPYRILICKDAMEDKVYAFGSKSLKCISDDGKEGFGVRISFGSNPKGEVKYRGLMVSGNIGGGCVEKSQLIFLFDDETKWNNTSWNDFNCDGDSYFDFTTKGWPLFTEKRVVAIRFVNGRNQQSFTYKVPESERDYFMLARRALEQKLFDYGSMGDGGACDN